MATASSSANPGIRFGVFELDTRTGELRKSGYRMSLRPQAAKVLAMLASRPGHLVTREEIKHEIWGHDRFVDFENGLNLCIRHIRAVLDDNAETPRYIETLPRRGYRFIAPVLSGVPFPSPSAIPDGVIVPSRQNIGAAAISRMELHPLRFGAVAVAITLIAFVGLSVYRGQRPLRSSATSGRIDSLAVLPLENLSHDAEQEYFADGTTDELITDLAKIRSLKVISRTSVMQYKGTHKSAPQIGQALKVDAVVEGTVRRSGQLVRINVRLIQAATDRQLWAESYDGNLSDVFGLQREVALSIAREIRVKLTPEEQASFANPVAVKSEAHDAYLRGRYFWNKRTRDGLLKAREYFDHAIEIDPHYALGYAGLADTYQLMGSYEVLPSKEAVLKAKAAAKQALDLNDALAEPHACLGTIAADFEWDWPTAERELKRSVDLNPGYATAHQWYAEYLMNMGRFEEAAGEFQRAQALDPFSIIINRNMGLPYFLARQFDVALEHFRKTVALDPSSSLGYFMLGWTHELKGEFAEGIVQLQKARQIDDSPLTVAHLAHTYAVSGRKNEATKLLAELQTRSRHEYVSPICMAVIYEGLGDKDQALKWLEKGYQQHAYLMAGLRVDPRWDSLRSAPRFQSLVYAMNLPS